MFGSKRQTIEAAPMLRPSDGDVLPPALHALRPQEASRAHVVTATNDAAPPHAWLVTAGVVLFIPTVLAVLIYVLGAGPWLSLLTWAGVAVFLGYNAMLLVSGEWPALREIRANMKVREKEIAAASRAIDRHYDVQEKMVDLEMARIERASADEAHIRLLMAMHATLQRMADAADIVPVQAQAHTFVPSTPSEAVTSAKRWIAAQMADSTDGNAPSLANVPMPWNAEWKAKPWATDARTWLLDNVIERHGTVYRWREEFATVADAQNTLRRL